MFCFSLLCNTQQSGYSNATASAGCLTRLPRAYTQPALSCTVTLQLIKAIFCVYARTYMSQRCMAVQWTVTL
jgi:hypothetical protein